MPKHDVNAQIPRSALTLILAIACFALSSPTLAASFPCEKAASAVEKKICSDPELSILDEYLGRYYSAARLSLSHAEACFTSDQRNWLRTVRDVCKDSACLKHAYLQRLAVLDALQPGATSLRNTELPRVPPLVWIIPPALDEVAAPRNRSTKPLVASGKLMEEVTDGDGYVIQDANGKRHLVVPLMFLEPSTAAALASLTRTPNAVYEARGRSEASLQDAEHFAPSACTFLYRTSP